MLNVILQICLSLRADSGLKSLPRCSLVGSPNWSKLLNSGLDPEEWGLRLRAELGLSNFAQYYFSPSYYQTFEYKANKVLDLSLNTNDFLLWLIDKYSLSHLFCALMSCLYFVFQSIQSWNLSPGCYHSDIWIKSLQCFVR